jgi:hypothetical protein
MSFSHESGVTFAMLATYGLGNGGQRLEPSVHDKLLESNAGLESIYYNKQTTWLI